MAQPISQSKRKICGDDSQDNGEKRLKLQDTTEALTSVTSSNSEEIETPALSTAQDEATPAKLLRSSFENLPTELFNLIYNELYPSSVLAMKFICRSFNARLRNLPGSRIVDLHEEIHFADMRTKYKREELQSMAKIMLEYESRSPVRLGELTCAHCAQSRGNNKNGYSDANFDQNNRNRMCLTCKSQLRRRERNAVHFRRTYLIEGSPHVICCDCRDVLHASLCRRLSDGWYQCFDCRERWHAGADVGSEDDEDTETESEADDAIEDNDAAYPQYDAGDYYQHYEDDDDCYQQSMC